MADINYPELGDVSEHRRWYNEGDLFHHPSGVVLQAKPSGHYLPDGTPILAWVPLTQEPAQ